MESVYEVVLAKALEKRGLRVQRQVPFRFQYDGVVFEEDIQVSDLSRFSRARLINAMIDLEESRDVDIIK